MKNFVFDLYGTLIDIRTDEQSKPFKKSFTAKYSAVLGNDFFKKYTAELEKATADDELTEPDVAKIFKQIAGERGRVLNDGEVKIIAEDFRKGSLKRLKLYPHVESLLKKLRAGGAKLYILSNAQSCFTMPEIERLKLKEYFDGIELSSDFGYKKPSPLFFDYVIEKYGLARWQTVYVGNDIVADVCAAKRAGLTAVYVYSAISPANDSLEEAGKVADYAASDHRELKKILLDL